MIFVFDLFKVSSIYYEKKISGIHNICFVLKNKWNYKRMIQSDLWKKIIIVPFDAKFDKFCR